MRRAWVEWKKRRKKRKAKDRTGKKKWDTFLGGSRHEILNIYLHGDQEASFSIFILLLIHFTALLLSRMAFPLVPFTVHPLPLSFILNIPYFPLFHSIGRKNSVMTHSSFLIKQQLLLILICYLESKTHYGCGFFVLYLKPHPQSIK